MTSSNASNRIPATHDPSRVKDIYDTSDFGVPTLAPDEKMRVLLVDGTLYRCHGTIVLPLFWIPKVVAPGQFSLVSFGGPSLSTLLVDGSDVPTFWGRDISAISFDRLSFVDISDSGAGQGSVLIDIVGGNGELSFLAMAQSTVSRFKRIATTVDVALSLGEATQDFACLQGWVARRNPGLLTSHYMSGRQFTDVAAGPPHAAAGVSILGDAAAVSIIGNAVQLGRPENSFIHIDSGTTTGSYTILGQNWVGPSQGQFFRPDISDGITGQIDVSVAVSSFADSSVAPGVDTQVNMGAIVDLTRGQVIAISGGTYAGAHTIVRVADDQLSFDIAFVFAGASAGTLALTKHTVASCTFVRDETVTVSGTTNYNGTFNIVSKTDTAFVLPQPFVVDDATGTADSIGRDQTSPGVDATGNGAQPDSQALAEICWNANADPTPVADGTPGPLVLTNVMQTTGERLVLTDPATAEVTYVGVRPGSLSIRINITGSTAFASLRSYRVKVAKNQAVVGSAYSTFDIRAESKQIVYQAIVDVVNGDEIRIEIEGQGTTDSPTIIEGQIIIS